MGNAQHTAGKKLGLTETGHVSTVIFFLMKIDVSRVHKMV